ncbi:MAG: c-type cytochrome, partial [Pseudomonadota bacterium]
PATYNEQYVKALKQRVETSGDFDRGRLAYQKAATCAACHKINGAGGEIGPDLTDVGSGRSLELLIESVLWPNRQIREGYMTAKITTKDNQLHVGYRLSEEGGVIRLREIATPKVKKIARADIKSEEDAGSSMVAGLTAGLTEAELADLISYLAGLKKK